MKPKFMSYFMDVAFRTAELSYAQRLKVGAVAVKNNRIIATGFNGTPEGWDNACEDENNVTKLEVIHAEENIICQLASSGNSGRDADMFVTHAPCPHCAVKLFQTGFKNIYYRDIYRNMDGVSELKKFGVNVIKC